MARTKRLFIPGQTCFLLLEGHNGNNCFYDQACYTYYLARLTNCLAPFQVVLHAYVLLPNEIQLLLTPSTPTGISELMKVTGGAYVQYFNNRFARNGSLWKGRFRSSLIQSDQRLPACQKYIELAPLRQGLASHPGEYEWSSYCANAFGGNPALSLHDEMRKLLREGTNRFQYYRDFIAAPVSRVEHRKLDEALRLGHPLIDSNFRLSNVKVIKKSRRITTKCRGDVSNIDIPAMVSTH
ncbi:MAG: transposase [Pseudohongiellaceae bacterium]